MRTYPALDVHWPPPIAAPSDEQLGLVLAAVDAEGPTAVEPVASGVRLFFPTGPTRSRAAIKLVGEFPELACTPVDVPDEGWAERSQAALGPVTVGDVTVAPPGVEVGPPAGIVIRIQPSMGFGTGHHASTRLMLSLLQSVPVTGRSVLDVGTGSGVLALAARALGAADVVAIDVDPDALLSARENVALNGGDGRLTVREVDLARAPTVLGRRFDVVLANLTGATIARYAGELARLTAPSGRLVVSGFQLDEAAAVAGALADAGFGQSERAEEEGWYALTSPIARAAG